jgi:cell division protein FtsB
VATSSAYPARRATRRSSSGGPSTARAGVRWDRVGRLALLGVLVVLVYLYVSAGISLLGTWHASKQDNATVSALKQENAALRSERSAERRGYETETHARKLGMARPGEKLFDVSNLPRD